MANAPKFSMPAEGGKPAGAPGFPSMVIVRDDTVEQPLPGQQGQQSAPLNGNGNEEIPDDVIEAFLNGQTTEGEGQQAEGGQQGQEQTSEDQTPAEGGQGDIQQQIQTAVAQAVAPLAAYIQGLVQGQGPGGQRQGQEATPKSFLDLAREKVRSRNPDLSDASVEFLAGPLADVLESAVGDLKREFGGQINALQGNIGQVQSTMGTADLNRTLDTWMDERKVPADDRADIKDLVAIRTLQKHGQNATARHLRAEFEGIVGKRVKASVAKTDQRRINLTNANAQPPPGGQGAAGDADVTRQILKSKKPEDDIGGTRWQRLVARYIQG